MADAVPFREKYSSRFIANAALLTITWALAWLWFTAHVKPHVSTFIFSGVSVATFAGVAAAVFGSFFEKGEAMNVVTRLLKSKRLTPALIVVLPLIVFVYLTTFTLYLTAADGAGDVRLDVTRGRSRTPVMLSALEKQKAVTYFFAFRAVTATVHTLAPSGFNDRDLTLRRAIPVQLTVPDAASQKKFHLVRLMPLDNLFQLRGRREPDMSYVVRLFVPRRRDPIEHAGLAFRAIYIGASLAELQSQSKNARAAVDALKGRLAAMDIPAADAEGIIEEWLGEPELLDTPELAPGDKVRIVVESPAGKTETTVKVVKAGFSDAFLAGAEQ
jgi:hypothetical protein